MPILFVNGKRRGLRIRGRAAVSNPARRRARRNPGKRVFLTPYKKSRYPRTPGAKAKFETTLPFLAPYRAKKKNPAHRRRRKNRQPAALRRYWAKHGTRTRRRHRMPKGLRDYWAKKHGSKARRRRRLKTNPSRRRHAMAKGSKKRSAAMKRYWRARKRAGKQGGLGRTRRRRRRARHVAAAPKRRRRARKSVHVKRRRARRSRRRTVRGGGRTRRTKMRRKMTRRRRSSRRNTRRMHMMLGPDAATVRMNPSRRRRKRRRSHRRGYTIRRRRRRHSSRRSHRRGRRRSYRRYRRNPGLGIFGDLLGGMKRVIPGALSFIANRMIVNKVGPMLPVVSSLGTLQGPVLSFASLALTHFATKRGPLAKYREEALWGARFQLLASAWNAFAPASIQTAIGEYVNMGDYVAVGGAPPLNERFTLSDYVAVGGDGVEEELGMGVSEELGVDEELGNVLMGGLPGPVSGSMGMLKPVPTQQFIQAIPARSFTRQIPQVTNAYDNASDLYAGIFGGKFGGG